MYWPVFIEAFGCPGSQYNYIKTKIQFYPASQQAAFNLGDTHLSNTSQVLLAAILFPLPFYLASYMIRV